MILCVRHFAVSSIPEKLETKFQKMEEAPDSEGSSPLQGKKAKTHSHAVCFCLFFDSCCGIDSEEDSNAIVSYVENQLQLTEQIPCLFA